jgi:flagellar P-ring protein precursor FlgI
MLEHIAIMKLKRSFRTVSLIALATWFVVGLDSAALARTQLKNICRIKGQEENTLRGLGLVIGLNGTGQSGDAPTMRAVARAMEVMGAPLASVGAGGGLEELRNIKNVALVMVTATVPSTGARRGDRLDCFVSAINGKSLEGGRLAFASLQGPNTLDKRVYALCQGQVTIDNPEQPMVGVVQDGCQMEADVFTPFCRDGNITLILDKNHANFQTAAAIAVGIREKFSASLMPSAGEESSGDAEVVRAIDAANIVVQVPKQYRKDPVSFASMILEVQVYDHEPEARVVINPRAGSIVISGDMEIGDVVVSHKNIVVEAGTTETFSSLDIDDSNQPKLQQLVDQLNALKVPTQDMIEIIRGIERNGKLHGRLIIE